MLLFWSRLRAGAGEIRQFVSKSATNWRPLPKAEMKDQMSRMFARATSITPGPITVTRFVFDKQGATVYESGSLTLTLMVSGQKSVIQTGGSYRDFWVKTGTGWLEKSSSSLSSKSTLNGKPVP